MVAERQFQRTLLIAVAIGLVVAVVALPLWNSEVKTKYKSVTDYFSGGVNTIQSAHMLADDVLSDAIGAATGDNGTLTFKPYPNGDASAAQFVTMKNLVANGNFASTTDWTATGATFSVSSNTGYVTGNGTAATISGQKSLTADPEANDIIWVKVKARVNDATCSSIKLNVVEGVTTRTIFQIDTPEAGEWYELYGTRTALDDIVTFQVSATYADAATANNKILYLQYAVLLNETADLGSGFELSSTAMYSAVYLKSPEYVWFNGTASNFQIPAPHLVKLIVGGVVDGETFLMYDNGIKRSTYFYNTEDLVNFTPSVTNTRMTKFSNATDEYAVFYTSGDIDTSFWYANTTGALAVTEVDLPVNLTNAGIAIDHMENHLYRLFWTSKNILNWTAAGTIDSFYAGTPGTAFVSEDSGINTFWGEGSATGLVSFKDALYIFFPSSIYVLRGDAPENFYVTKIVDGLGATEVARTANNLYFSSNLTDKIYRFDGASYPVEISNPVIANGSYLNGVKSGFAVDAVNTSTLDVGALTALVGLRESIYVFARQELSGSRSAAGGDPIQSIVWEFDERTSSWWKHGGFTSVEGSYGAASYSKNLYTNATSVDGSIYWTVNIPYYASTPAANVFLHKHGSRLPDADPYMITRAYGDSLSSKSSLRDIYLQISKTPNVFPNTYTHDIFVYVSKSISGDDDWELISPPTMMGVLLDSTVQTFRLIVPAAYGANTGSYRIKIVADGHVNDTGFIHIHQMQRRYRVRD